LNQSVTMIWPSGLARHQDEDHVVEDLFHLRRVVGRQVVHELEGHLRGADLRGVNGAGDEQHQLALAEDLVPLCVGRRTALEVQLLLQPFVAVQVLERVRGADFERDERIAAAGLAELAEAHAVGIRRGQLHVVDDLVPAGKLVVGADLVAEELLGRLERSRRVDDHCRETGEHERGHQHAAANHEASREHYIIAVTPMLNTRSRMDAIQAPIIAVIGDLIRQNPGTISLGQGVVHYGPPQAALDAARAALPQPETHGYQDGVGIPQLVAAIDTKLRRDNGIDCRNGLRVMVTAGGNMAFVHAILAITQPGDEIILPVPFYFNHEMAIQMADCAAVLVPTDDRYQLNLDAIRRAITPRTRAIVTVTPNNPTGAVFPEAALREVNDLCARHGLFHISDEVYEYFTYGSAVHASPGAFDGANAHTISLFSLSKAYGFAGWRIGYMVYPERLHDAIAKVRTRCSCAHRSSRRSRRSRPWRSVRRTAGNTSSHSPKCATSCCPSCARSSRCAPCRRPRAPSTASCASTQTPIRLRSPSG
jgi:histidinol-phosphate/aromatic aminotransferase/cobyric acid decarboxylase-like protein